MQKSACTSVQADFLRMNWYFRKMRRPSVGKSDPAYRLRMRLRGVPPDWIQSSDWDGVMF